MDINILIAIIVSIPPTIMALLAWRQAGKTHQLVNSRMTELLELTRKSSKAEGVKEEQDRLY